MTKIKFCGLTRLCDVEAANLLQPDYIGFVFARKSRRCISPEQAAVLRKRLSERITPVGVFVDERPELVAELLERNLIAVAQLHGNEEESYLQKLRSLTSRPVIKAFRAVSEPERERASGCTADYLLFDSGTGGTGTVFDWTLLQQIKRPYFLAGGLNAANVGEAIKKCHPYAVDVSSGIETGGVKDSRKMAAFTAMVRNTMK